MERKLYYGLPCESAGVYLASESGAWATYKAGSGERMRALRLSCREPTEGRG